MNNFFACTAYYKTMHRSSVTMPTVQASHDGNCIALLDSNEQSLSELCTRLLLSSLLSQPTAQLLHKSQWLHPKDTRRFHSYWGNCRKVMVKKHWSTVLLLFPDRSGVVFKSFFTTTLVQQDSLVVFHLFLVSVVFTGPSLLVLTFYTKFLTLIYVHFLAVCMTANS